MHHPDPLIEKIAEQMLDHEQSNMARFHSMHGLPYWREFASIALKVMFEQLQNFVKEREK